MFDLGFTVPDGHLSHSWTFVGLPWNGLDVFDGIDATWWLGSDVLEVIGCIGRESFEMILPTAF